MISVVIPVFNKEETVERCVRSALAQTYFDIEVIAVNDGSTDTSADILASIHDERLRIFTTVNGGVSRARNIGIEFAKSDLICFLDSDDFWADNFVERMHGLATLCPQAGLLCGRYQIQDENGSRRKGSYSLPPDHFGYVGNFFRTYRESKSLVCSSSVAVRKHAILGIGGFPAEAKVGEDVFTWLEIAKHYAVAADALICSTISHVDSRTADRALETTPYFISQNLNKNRSELNNRDFVDFLSYYSIVYSALSVISGRRDTALRYYELWKSIRQSTALLCLFIALSPKFIWVGVRGGARLAARLRTILR